MSKLYQQLSIAELRPGMVLSDDVLDNQGAVLLARNAVLSVDVIASLARHRIHMVAVLTEPPEAAQPDPAADEEGHAVMQARLAYIFRKHQAENDMDWASGILWRYLEDFRTEREPEA